VALRNSLHDGNPQGCRVLSFKQPSAEDHRADDVPDNAVFSAGTGYLKTNQQRPFLFSVELKLQLIHPFLQLLDLPMCGSITPTQFGPMIRNRPRRPRICCSSSAPLGPHSLNPAEMMIAPFTPAAAHSPTILGTVAAGVAITARSTSLGTSPIFESAF
jgi:hypothetical protein